MTLVEFLLARIAEDEATAANSKTDAASGKTLGIPASWMSGVADRVLAECEAHRRIVELHDIDGHECPPEPDYHVGPCPTLRALAVIYADHPDYDEAWRP